MQRTLILDVETTGVELTDKIVEIAWIEIDQVGNELSRVYSLIDPEMPISPSAMGVHHITGEMVEDAPTMEELMEIVIPDHFAPDDEITLICHSAQFDRRFVSPYMPVKDAICTLRLARYFWPDSPDSKLQTLRYLFGLNGGEGAHGAMEDVETTLALLRFMCETQGKTIADLQSLCQGPLPVTRMYFGKHRKTLLKDIPRGYRVWLLGTDIDEDLRYSLGAL